MDIAVLLYPDFTALDCVGPYEVLSRLPDTEVRFVSKTAGPVKADSGTLSIEATHALADLPSPEIILVPGGPGDEKALADAANIEWLRRAHESSTWTTSVCTGALLLGAAGILERKRATTHWARYDRLASFGATPVAERVVREGKVVTAAGVSAGIDMALELTRIIAGDDTARALQLGIEYDPAPPFDSGSVEKAPAPIVEMVRAFFDAQ